MPNIFLGLPFYSQLSFHTVTTILNAVVGAKGAYNITVDFASTSATPFCFNKLVSKALQTDCTHFVMLHSDLGVKEPDWINLLLNMLDSEELDVLSAVACIKNDHGLTSTAVDNREYFPRRLTLTEIRQGPITMTNEQCKTLHGNALLINTGCMIWKMDTLRKAVPEFAFEFRDGWLAMASSNDRILHPYFQPEDWLMSRYLNSKGIPFGVTRALTTLHEGSWVWASDGPIGTQLTDHQNLEFERLQPHEKVTRWPDSRVIAMDREAKIAEYQRAIEELRHGEFSN